MSKDAIIVGYSGHAYVVCDLLQLNGISIIGYCEKTETRTNPFGLRYLGDENEQSLLTILSTGLIYLGVGDNYIRAKAYKYLNSHSLSLPSLCHQGATISSSANLGSGTVVMASAVVNALVDIGDGVICNTGSIIEHECQIGDFSHVAPGAVLAGNVRVGQNSFIGAISVIKQGIKIGSNVVIGAGSVVLNDIHDDEIVAGNPAKSLRI